MQAQRTKARRRRAVASTGVAAGLVTVVSIYVPSYLSLFVEQRELLLLLTALLGVLLVALHKAAEHVSLLGDNFIDRFEAFHLDWLLVFQMLAIFASVAYAGQIFIDYFMAGPVAVPNLLLCIVTLLGLALALLPLVKRIVLHADEDADADKEA